MVYQISIVLKDINVSVSWDKLAEALTKEFRTRDVVMERNGSFQCKFFFSGDQPQDSLRDRVKEAIRLAGGAAELDPSAFAVSTKAVEEADLSKLKPDTIDSLQARDWIQGKRKRPETADETKPSAESPWWRRRSRQPEPEKEEAGTAAAKAPEGGPGMPETTAAERTSEKPRKAPEDKDEDPLRRMTLTEVAEKLASDREVLLSKVRGQHHAVNELTQGFFEGEMFARYDEKRQGPISTFRPLSSPNSRAR